MNTIRNVPLGQPSVGSEELAAVQEVFESGWLAGAGPNCLAFEGEFAQVHGVDHALSTTNCGSALYLGLQVLKAGPGDEVIVGDYTFPATGHAVAWTGATPRFADVRPDTWCLDPAAVEALVTDRNRRDSGDRCIWAASRLRRTAGDRRSTRSVAFSRMQPAQRVPNTRADPPEVSATWQPSVFNGRKGITAGEGGALVGHDADHMALARKLHTYGIAPAVSREGAETLSVPSFDMAGFNFRLSEVQAAIMRVQLKRLPELHAVRAKAAAMYEAHLGALEQFSLPVALSDRAHAWQSFVITFSPGVDRDRVAIELRKRGVGCNFGTYASHLQPVYGSSDRCPISADLFSRHLAIPMHSNLTEDDVLYVSEVLTDVVSKTASATR